MAGRSKKYKRKVIQNKKRIKKEIDKKIKKNKVKEQLIPKYKDFISLGAEKMSEQERVIAKEMLSKISIKNLKQDFNSFLQSLSLDMSDDEIINKLKSFIPHKSSSDGKTAFLDIVDNFELKKGSKFFRIRKIKQGQSGTYEELKIESDIWAPPEKYVTKYQRINEPNQSILYVTNNQVLTLQETGIKEGEKFVFIEYEALTSLSFRCVTIKTDASKINFDKEEIKKLNLIDDFYRKLFSAKIEGNKEELIYKVSNIIARKILPLENEQVGWCYRPVAGGIGFNFALEPKNIKDKLKVVEITVGIKGTDIKTNRDKILDAEEFRCVDGQICKINLN